MRRTNLITIVSTPFLIFFLSCSSSRVSNSSSIGLLPLEYYIPTWSAHTADTTYKVFQTDAAFRKAFTVAAGEAPRSPNFSSQMVVAILFKEGVGQSLRFENAEVSGSTVTVFARSCMEQNCGNAVATIPKVANAKTIRFIINGNSTGKVDL